MFGRRASVLFFAILALASACSNDVETPAAPTSTASPTAIPALVDTPIPVTTATAVPIPIKSPTPTIQIESPTATPVSAIPTATAVPQRATPAPPDDIRYGGTLNLVSRENIAHYDVHQDVSPALSTWGPGIAYSRLMRFKTGPNIELPSLAVECELCSGWTMLDETTYEFEIHDDVQWHDIQPVGNRSLTAEDIAYSYNRQRQDGFANAPLMHIFDTIEATDEGTLRVTLLAPDVDFMQSLADGHSKIIAREVVEANGDLRNGPTVGTGPWIFTSTQPNVAHTFEGNPTYFESGLPIIDRLTMHIIPDENTRKAAFRVRSIDVAQMEPTEWAEFSSRQPNALFLMAKESSLGLEVGLKTTVEPFDDIRVRQAALLAMNPWQAVEETWFGNAYVSQGVPVPGADWLLPEDELRPFFGDSGRAREILQSTYNGTPVTIRVGDFSELFVSHAQRIADEMREVGFDTNVEVVNRRRFGEEVWLGGDYQMFVGPIAPTTSTNSYLFPILHSQGFWNTTEMGDPSVDALIEAQAQEFDFEIRRELLLEIQRRTLENAHRFMPAKRVSIWTWWPRVQNFHPNFAGFEYSHWSKVWLNQTGQ